MPSRSERRIRRLLRLLKPMTVVGFNKIRLGRSGDGGYVQIDDRRLRHAISLGIGDDYSWDWANANRGIEVAMLDHSIDISPSHPLLEFQQRRADASVLRDLIAQCFGPLILKCDIDGDEWNLFDNLDENCLRSCAQIICEFHWLDQLTQREFFDRAFRVFTKLNAGFAVCHLHGNNCGAAIKLCGGAIEIPETLEVTFANRDFYELTESVETFPTPIDRPNTPDNPEIMLGNFVW